MQILQQLSHGESLAPPPPHSLWTLNLHGNVALSLGEETVWFSLGGGESDEWMGWRGGWGKIQLPISDMDHFNAICY